MTSVAMSQDLIQKYLPQELWKIAKNFDIPQEFLENNSELVTMILKSRSIDTTEEKQNRFNLLPLMNDEQMVKLRWILTKEKTKLKEIEEKYSMKKDAIKDKYLQPEDPKVKEKTKQIKDKESKIAAKELEQADNLLDMI